MAAALTTPQSSQVLVGSSGTVYLAPVGTAAPTNIATALNAAFVEVGFITENGVTIRDEKSVKAIKAWQTPYDVRKVVTERTFAVSFEMEQLNWQSLVFALGGGTLSEPSVSEYKYIPPDADDLDVRAMVVAWIDGTKSYRLYMPNGIVTEAVEMTLKRDEASLFPITFGANFDGTNPAYTVFSNDPAFEFV